jgi:hypothetical protein
VQPGRGDLFFKYWGLNSGPHSCKADALALEPALFCFSYFLGRVLHFCLWVLISDHNPPTCAYKVDGISRPASLHLAY